YAAMRTVAASFLQLLPAHRRPARGNFGHGDASRDRTHQRTEITADALVFQHARHMLRRYAVAEVAGHPCVDLDALVRAVFAGDVAEVAADTLRRVDLGDDLVVQIEVAPVVDLRQRLAHEIRCGTESLVLKIVLEPLDHVTHDAKAIMHGRGADLNRRRT